MDIDQLLTSTRSARRSLDLDAPVDRGAIRECLRIGMQAPNGSNQQSWRWLVISDESLRGKLAALYRDAYLQRVGGQLIADLMPAGTPETKIMSSTEWLVENLAKVPLLVIPCYQPYPAGRRR
jgi:nitroreductase